MTFNLLAKLIKFYEKAGKRESIDSVVDEYYRQYEMTRRKQKSNSP